MRLNATMQVNLRTKDVAAMGQGCAREFASIMGDLVKIQAQKNVAPGKGPSEHPHKVGSHHIDTGNLMASIQKKQVSQGFMETSYVYSDVPYAVFLEVGWVSKAGNAFRYPFLQPALEQVQGKTADILRTSVKKWFSEEGRMYKGSKSFE
jgi:hypothetical protein